jgi:carboxyl-terminal processing protease
MEQLSSSPPSSHRRRPFFGVVFLLLAFMVGMFVGGWEFARLSPSEVLKQTFVAESEGERISFDLFWDVWNRIQDHYVDAPVDEQQLLYGSIQGLVRSLDDPYSIFLDPEQTKDFMSQINGTFEGIGAEIDIEEGKLVIIAPLKDSPAEHAGLQAGDWILRIDEEETTDLSAEEAVSKIRGPKGTVVKLEVLHSDATESVVIEITRDEIKVESVKWEFRETSAGTIAMVSIYHFNDDTTDLLNAAISEILVKDVKGLVLDLRNNPGGFLETSIEVASEFMDHDVVVTQSSDVDVEKVYKSEGEPRLIGMPTVVLVNGGSASASEIVAGALQDYKLATIIGQQTFGKGSVQDYDEFTDGSSLKLTIAKWLTPKGRTIQGEGIKPDIDVQFTQEDQKEKRDPQLDRALDELTKNP